MSALLIGRKEDDSEWEWMGVDVSGLEWIGVDRSGWE